MHPRIATLAAALVPLTENLPTQFTKADRDKLMALRNTVKNLQDEPGITLSDSDEIDRQYLYVISTRAANEQEDFWEKNGERWAETPTEPLPPDEADYIRHRGVRNY